MSEINVFEYATRAGLRFSFRGNLTVEDVWELTPTDLDALYRGLKEEQTSQTEGLIQKRETEAEKALSAKLEIVQHIFKIKREEADLRALAAKRREQKRRLQAILADKQDQDLQGKSVEELQKLLAEMED